MLPLVDSYLSTLIVVSPALAAILTVVLGLRSRIAATCGLLGSSLSLGAASLLLAGDFRGVHSIVDWAPELGLIVSWRLETAPLALAILVASVGLLVKQYTASYFKADGSLKILFSLGIFETAMLGLVLSDNLFLLFLFWELTGIVSFFLIQSDPTKAADAYCAARNALLVTVAGALPFLVAIILIWSETGSASLAGLIESGLPVTLQTLVLILILPAVLTKSAQTPFHFWLPGAMAAPTPVSAYLHSATMVKAGIILLLYFYPVLGGSPFWTGVLVPVGALTCLWGSYRALAEDDIKLLLAWSTVSQLGLLTLTIGLGTDLAIRAASLHLFAHAVFKAGLFLSVGVIDKMTGTRRLTELGGLRSRAPGLFVVVAILAGSMAGLPPLAGFLSKELILKKAMLTEWWVHSSAIVAIVLGSVGTIAYSSRLVFEVFLGSARSDRISRASAPHRRLFLGPAVLASVSALAGPFAGPVDRWFLEPFAGSLIGIMLEAPQLSLWYGVNAALILTVIIVGSGYLFERSMGLRFLPADLLRPGGARLLEQTLEASQRVGAGLSKLLSGARPRHYFSLAIVAGFVLPGLWIQREAPAGPLSWDLSGLFVVALLATALIAVILVKNRLGRVLLLSIAGFAVAILFRLMNAPDLMLTQFLVEVLLTIFFALSLQYLPRQRALGWNRGAFTIALAASGGLGAGMLTLAVGKQGGSSAISAFYQKSGPEVAKGLNLVNVILTDFRALDTLMETLVVVLAALGVAGFMQRTQLRQRKTEGTPRCEASGFQYGLLPSMAVLVVPIAILFALVLLLKGHNEPGGGFVAGLSLGIAAVVGYLGLRPPGQGEGIRLPALSVALLGTGLMFGTVLASLPNHGSALTHFHGEIVLMGQTIQLNSVLLFDLGVSLAVSGGIALAVGALWHDSSFFGGAP